MAAILNYDALWGVQGMAGKKTKRLCMGFCEFLVGESPKTWNCLGETVETTLRCPGCPCDKSLVKPGLYPGSSLVKKPGYPGS